MKERVDWDVSDSGVVTASAALEVVFAIRDAGIRGFGWGLYRSMDGVSRGIVSCCLLIEEMMGWVSTQADIMK